jgi:peptidoglycan hydrolase-like protein with peptidoglycan-binding domain
LACIAGCGRKQETLEESQVPMSMEAMSSLSAESQAAATAKTPEASIPVQAGAKLEAFPPASTAKPTALEIQTALKNVGLYGGPLDGKIGPLTKKAIEDFQKANGLEADGKVGPKTWALLSTHLIAVPSEAKPKKR